MEKEWTKELAIIILASIILGLSVSFLNKIFAGILILFFFIIIIANTLGKKITAAKLDAKAKIKFWDWYQYWFSAGAHFKKPIPMFWVAPILSLFSMGYIWWLAILETEITPKIERVSKRHSGFHKFAEMTDKHIAQIVASGVFSNLLLAILAFNLAGFFPNLGLTTLAKLSIYYACWSILPLGSLDGSKFLFGRRILYLATLILCSFFLAFSFLV